MNVIFKTDRDMHSHSSKLLQCLVVDNELKNQVVDQLRVDWLARSP